MVDRYILHSEGKTLINRFNLGELPEYKPTFNAVPTREMPVIQNTAVGVLSMIPWGQTSSWAKSKKLSLKLYNASLGDITAKRSLQTAWNERRCLIPATGFVAWNKVGKKTAIPYLYHLPDFVPFCMAGLWDIYSNLDETSYHTFKMLIAPRSSYGVDIPVVLEPGRENDWLTGQIEEPESLSHTKVSLEAYAVSPVIHHSQIDNEDLIRRVSPMDQQGNYTLFG